MWVIVWGYHTSDKEKKLEEEKIYIFFYLGVTGHKDNSPGGVRCC